MKIKNYSLLAVASQVVTGENFEKEQDWADKFMEGSRVLPSSRPTFLDLKIEPQIQRALILYTIIGKLIKKIGAEGFHKHRVEVENARQSQEFCMMILANFCRKHTGRSDLFKTGFKVYKGWLLVPSLTSRLAITEDFLRNHAMPAGN